MMLSMLLLGMFLECQAGVFGRSLKRLSRSAARAKVLSQRRLWKNAYKPEHTNAVRDRQINVFPWEIYISYYWHNSFGKSAARKDRVFHGINGYGRPGDTKWDRGAGFNWTKRKTATGVGAFVLFGGLWVHKKRRGNKSKNWVARGAIGLNVSVVYLVITVNTMSCRW